MARRSRVEYPGAIYHVINRGNYRSFIFETAGARKSFLECLDLCCEAQGWLLHAWVLMGNHYHLCMETPHPNLVEGMKWLNSTFANRFNQFRKSNGHVFQGRYKAILLDGEALGAVCHYIHLNPVRAGLVTAGELQKYADSSFAGLWYPKRRRAYEFPDVALEFAGGLADSPAGRRKYRDYLAWLSETDEETKRLGFESMSSGWSQGSQDFKRSVLEDLADKDIQKVVESEAAEMREPRWSRALAEGLEAIGRSADELASSRKGEAWKVDLARFLRERHLVPYRWVASSLLMGAPSYVQSLVSRRRKAKDSTDWAVLKRHGKLD
jgi:REP element-mobilizing transposase RayT